MGKYFVAFRKIIFVIKFYLDLFSGKISFKDCLERWSSVLISILIILAIGVLYVLCSMLMSKITGKRNKESIKIYSKMKHFNHLLLLPIVILSTIVVSSCSGLTDEEKKFVGTWSSELYMDSVIDEESHIRYIFAAYDQMTYNEDKTYTDEMDASIKLEWNFDDASIRMYWYYKGNGTNSWSADNGIYSDSTINYNVKNIVAPSNAIAIKWKGSDKVIRFGIYNIPNNIDPNIAKAIKELYNEETKSFDEMWNNRGKFVYKIISLTDNQIVYENNDGEKSTLNKGNVISPRARQMIAEGEALK